MHPNHFTKIGGLWLGGNRFTKPTKHVFRACACGCVSFFYCPADATDRTLHLRLTWHFPLRALSHCIAAGDTIRGFADRSDYLQASFSPLPPSFWRLLIMKQRSSTTLYVPSLQLAVWLSLPWQTGIRPCGLHRGVRFEAIKQP